VQRKVKTSGGGRTSQACCITNICEVGIAENQIQESGFSRVGHRHSWPPIKLGSIVYERWNDAKCDRYGL
jgi:hypothetical protein